MEPLERNDDGTFGCLSKSESDLYENVVMTSGEAAGTIKGLLEKIHEARNMIWIDMVCRPDNSPSKVLGLETKFLGRDLLDTPGGVWKRLVREFVTAVRIMENSGCRPDIKPDRLYALELFFEEQKVRSANESSGTDDGVCDH